MYTITLDAIEMEYLRAQMQLAAMNERGAAAATAETIAEQVDAVLLQAAQRRAADFACDFLDLFPAGGRE